MQRWRMLVAWTALAICGSATAAPPTSVESLDDVLLERIDFEAEGGSLAETLKALEQTVARRYPNVSFTIKIIGKDLEAEGITRNKRVGALSLEKRRVGELLTLLVQTGNPNGSDKDLTSDDQALVWVVAADPDDKEKTVVLLTTRKAAKAKKYRLEPPSR